MKTRIRTLLSNVSINSLCVVGLVIVVLYFNPWMIRKIALLQRKEPVKQNSLPSNQYSGGQKDLWSTSEEETIISYSHAFDVEKFYKVDLVTNNNMVDKLSSQLRSHLEVIEEAQRIHLNMFKTLIGSYKYAMLFNLAVHENKGDPAIGVGELKMIQKLGLELIYHCREKQCRAQNLNYAKLLSNNYTSDDLVILMHGGGNLISYEKEDEFRKLVLEQFRNFHAVLFPQSVWPRANMAHQLKFQKVYASHPRLTFLYRDRHSYELGKKFWPKAQPYLVPDMAFEIGAVSRLISPTHDILWLQRGDKESGHYNIPKNTQGFNVLVQDWRGWRSEKGTSNIEDVVIRAANGMVFLQRGRVVITDRLHGHILSTLCGIPHVVIDPTNHKITSYMKSWTGAVENIVVANSSEDALHKAIELLQKLDLKLPEALTFNNNKANNPE